MKLKKSVLSVIVAIALIAGGFTFPVVEAGTFARIDGVAVVGKTLTVVTDYAYERIDWFHYADATYPPIPGASGPTYTLTQADLGHIIYVNIILPGGGFGTQLRTFDSVKWYELSGSPVVGKRIEVAGVNIQNPVYAFYKNDGGWKPIQTSMDNSYVIKDEDEGFEIVANVFNTSPINENFAGQTNVVGPVVNSAGLAFLSKVNIGGEDKYKININNWNPNFRYQIWTYERISSGIFEVNDINQWRLKQGFKAGRDFALDSDGSIMHLFNEFDSSDDIYTVAVKVIDSAGNFVGKIKGTYTPSDIGRVVINSVMADNKKVQNNRVIRDIESNEGKVEIKVTANEVLGVQYEARVRTPSGESMIPLKQGSTDTFVWDFSGINPGRYIVNIKAFTENSSDWTNVEFNLYKSDTIRQFGVMTGAQVTATGSGENFAISISPEISRGEVYNYRISEPWRAAIKVSEIFNVPVQGPISETNINKYGTYHVISYVRRVGVPSADDGVIRTVTNKRPGNQSMTINLNASEYTGGIFASARLNPITISPSGNFDNLEPGETLQYSYWRRDAKGWVMIRDYGINGNLTWTPARLGLYTIQIRAKGSNAESYEVLRNIEFNITGGGNVASVSEISINTAELESATARTPIMLSASATSSDEDLLYKYIISNGYIYYVETQYSSDPDYMWVPGKAGTYNVSVLVKNSVSFGKYDAVASFSVDVKEPLTYYVSNSIGDDANDGLSPDTPWKTLAKVSSKTYSSGDKILLKAGDVWVGETLTLNGNGTENNPITLSMYGSGDRPKISPHIIDAICISGSGLSGWKIMNLELSNAKTGIDLKYEHDYGNDFIWIENIYFHSMTSDYNSKTYEKITQQQRDVFLDHGNQSGGIYVRTQTTAGATYHFNQPVMLTNLTIIDSDFYDCEFAIWTGATINGAFQPAGKDYGRIDGLRIQNITARKMGMWGINIAFTDNGIISDSLLENLGFKSNRFGACALLVSYGDNVHFDNMTVLNQHRHPDQNFDAVAFDFEGGTSNCSITNSRFLGVDGPGILITYNLNNPNYDMLIENNVIEDFNRSYTALHPAIYWAVNENVPNSTGIIRNNTFISYRANLPAFGFGAMTTNYTGDPYSTIQFSNNTLTNRNSLAVGRPISASSSALLNQPANARDNNISTFWRASSTAYPQWLQVDLGAVYAIDTIHQQFSSTSEWKYWVGVSNDPTFETFQTVVDRTSGFNGAFFTDKVDHLNVSGRYVRISFINSGNGLRANSSEFKIYGTLQ